MYRVHIPETMRVCGSPEFRRKRELFALYFFTSRASHEVEIQWRHEFQRKRRESIKLCILRVLECFLRAIKGYGGRKPMFPFLLLTF